MDLKLGASVWGFRRSVEDRRPAPGDVARAILGFDPHLGIEVWADRALGDPPPEGAAVDLLAKACVSAPFVAVHMREAYWGWNPRTFRDEINFASRIGAQTLVIHPRCLRLDRPDARPDYPEIVRVLKYAGRKGVMVVLENTPDTVWALDRALEEIGDDPAKTNLAICIDTGHAHQSVDAGRHPVVNYIERYAAQLRHLHLHDNHGEADEHLVPGDGTIDWPSVIAALERVNYHGTSAFEIHDSQGDPLDALRRACETLNRSCAPSS